MLTSLGLAFLAGALSILSPCVLPLLPVVFGSAAAQGRSGPLALGAGVVVSFVSVGLFVAVLGFSIGLDGGVFRAIAAALLVLIGVILLVPFLQGRLALALASGPVAAWAEARLSKIAGQGAAGQFAVGILLGAVWSPCVGPTLGAASLLAAQGKDLVNVAATMAAFAVGVAVPLILIGSLSRGILQPARHRMLKAGKGFKAFLGATLVLAGGLILAGLDKPLEAVLVAASPAWLTELTTRF
ncbi:MAG: cytochrome c biogenesis CcdA family protein [Aestuariivirga sp.]